MIFLHHLGRSPIKRLVAVVTASHLSPHKQRRSSSSSPTSLIRETRVKISLRRLASVLATAAAATTSATAVAAATSKPRLSPRHFRSRERLSMFADGNDRDLRSSSLRAHVAATFQIARAREDTTRRKTKQRWRRRRRAYGAICSRARARVFCFLSF